MDLISKPYLSNVIYVLNYKVPDTKTRFKQAEAEAAFNGFVNGQSQQTNIPDSADPAQPRITFGNETKSITISQVTCQLNMRFAASGQDVEAQLQIVNKNVEEFYQRALKFMSKDSYQQSGLIYQIALPSTAPVASLHDYIFNRYYTVRRLGNVAAAQIVVGFEIDGMYMTLVGSVYENRKMEIRPGDAPPLFLDILTLPVVEYGLEFKVDINDRPRQKPGAEDVSPPTDLLQTGEQFIRNEFENFSGFKI